VQFGTSCTFDSQQSNWVTKKYSLTIASKLKFEKNHFTYGGMRNPDKMFQKLSNPDATTAAM
jgi:hypothetical protein